MKGNVHFYFHGAKSGTPGTSIVLEFNDGVLQNVLRKLMETEVRIDLNQRTTEEKDEFIIMPFRIFIELIVRRGLVPFTEGIRDER